MMNRSNNKSQAMKEGMTQEKAPRESAMHDTVKKSEDRHKKVSGELHPSPSTHHRKGCK